MNYTPSTCCILPSKDIIRKLAMKLISLNTWGGGVFEPLINFIKDQSSTTDIYCLQEIFDTTSQVKQHRAIRANLLYEIKKVLTDFQIFFFKILIGYDDEVNKVSFNLTHGPAILIRKNVKVDSHQNFFVYKPKSLEQLSPDFSDLATPLQYVSFHVNGKSFQFLITMEPLFRLTNWIRKTGSSKPKRSGRLWIPMWAVK